MSRTGSNHESNRVDSRVEQCRIMGRITSRTGLKETRNEQGRIMSRTGSNHETNRVES